MQNAPQKQKALSGEPGEWLQKYTIILVSILSRARSLQNMKARSNKPGQIKDARRWYVGNSDLDLLFPLIVLPLIERCFAHWAAKQSAALTHAASACEIHRNAANRVERKR
jgi:hypothetical protein